jgi:ketosteroid isomerase-like protein
MTLTAEDRAAISNLLGEYNFAVDSGDPEGWAATFTMDGVFEAPPLVVRGREALVAFVRENRIAGARHWLSNVVLQGDGDAASVRAYLAMGRWEDGRYNIFVTGSYTDTLSRTAEGWKFSHRLFVMDKPG